MHQRAIYPSLQSDAACLSVLDRRRDALRSQGAYRLRFAETREEKQAACRLRFLVFNLELNEGLDSAYRDGFDVDEIDSVCDHLIVEHVPTRAVIGTYRLQTGEDAARNLGYYSEREFDFSPYEPLRPRIVELGRAAIHRDHRSFEVLTLLWRGIADYARERNGRYLLGCSSLTSQSSEEGRRMFRTLEEFLVEPLLRTRPIPGYELGVDTSDDHGLKLRPPKLLLTYLAIGARICGEPAIDREFKTIDFLTLLDLENLAPAARARFFARNVIL